MDTYKHTTTCKFCRKRVTWHEEILMKAFCECGAVGTYFRTTERWRWKKGRKEIYGKPFAGKKVVLHT